MKKLSKTMWIAIMLVMMSGVAFFASPMWATFLSFCTCISGAIILRKWERMEGE